VSASPFYVTAREILADRIAWILIVSMLFLSGCERQAVSNPCKISVNGTCYDSPLAENPPLSASWEIIDADTKKPIPGVWISFFWLKFPDGRARGGTCARNVIGQTDANGRFSNTAKDGSWMFSEVHMFKRGFRRVYAKRLLEQTYITDQHNLDVAHVGKYLGWEEELLAMGYKLSTVSTTNNYWKDFELGNDYANILRAAWEVGGERQYWVSKRGIPDGGDFPSIGTQCQSKTLRRVDPEAQFVGYDGPNYDPNSAWNQQIAQDALETICDERWDLVPSDFAPTYADSYAGRAVRGLPQATIDEIVNLLPDYYSLPKPSRAMSRPERKTFCDYPMCQ
jgi:hypothetical protein